MELKEFKIQFSGLKEGNHKYEYKIEKPFFDLFEFDEFNGASVRVEVDLLKKATLMELAFKAEGHVNVNCDLTNEPYDQEISSRFELVVKFGEHYDDENEEILVLPYGEYEMNVAQYIYELIVLAVPTKRIHPGVEDGSLKSEILNRLEELSPKTADNTQKGTDPRWDGLKKLLTDK